MTQSVFLMLMCAGLICAQNTPQAFVPQLTPVVRVQPVYDAATLPASHVEVEFLLTISPAGRVVRADITHGNPAFREAAMAAVQQWQYRPVLRNGQPVVAVTNALVPLDRLGDRSFTMEPRNMNETLATQARLAALRQQFPRTPQIELEDLEQDRGSAQGIEREYALPNLAKAAYKAGAFEKALRYADESLRISAKANAGGLVHDGHVVRGLVALQRGDVAQAKQDLLDAGMATTTPALGSFGPNVTLAKALLEGGERDTVLEYFTRCRAFWKSGARQLDSWSDAVRQGKMPDFGANLAY